MNDRRRENGPRNHPPAPPEVRFWRHVAKLPGDRCWIWTGATARGDYGQFRVDPSTRVYAHRFAYEMAHGEIPQGLEVDHLCRERLCVRLDHLEAVTLKENRTRSNLFGGRNPAA